MVCYRNDTDDSDFWGFSFYINYNATTLTRPRSKRITVAEIFTCYFVHLTGVFCYVIWLIVLMDQYLWCTTLSRYALIKLFERIFKLEIQLHSTLIPAISMKQTIHSHKRGRWLPASRQFLELIGSLYWPACVKEIQLIKHYYITYDSHLNLDESLGPLSYHWTTNRSNEPGVESPTACVYSSDTPRRELLNK